MKQNYYKSREEIKAEKEKNRRTVATIFIVYFVVCCGILLMSYCENR